MMHAFSRRFGDRNSVTGLVTILVVGFVVVANFSGLGRTLLSGGGKRDVSAMFSTTKQLRKGNLVRIDGVNVGKVSSIASLDGGRRTKVVMKLDKSAGHLYGDASAAIRFRTLLGAAFVVDLDRGHASDGMLSDTIPVQRTSSQVELDDLTSVFRNGARAGLQTLPRELSSALADHATPGQLLGSLADASPDLTRALDAARGQTQDLDLQKLVTGTARTVDILGTSPAQLQEVVDGAAATLQTTGSHAEQLRATLATSPTAMRRTDVTLAGLDTTLALADPLVASLNKSAGHVAPTLDGLNPTVRDADALLTRARPLVRDLRPTVRSLATTAQKGLPLLNAVQPSLSRVDGTILPYLAAKDPGTAKSTTVMIGGTFAGLGAGSAGQEDANGHFLRFALSAGSAPLYLPCQTYINDPDTSKHVECESLQNTINSLTSYSPLAPTPGTSGAPSAPANSRSHP